MRNIIKILNPSGQAERIAAYFIAVLFSICMALGAFCSLFICIETFCIMYVESPPADTLLKVQAAFGVAFILFSGSCWSLYHLWHDNDNDKKTIEVNVQLTAPICSCGKSH
jgi:hypothetical protein